MVNLTQLFIASEPVISNVIGKLIYLLYKGIQNFGWTVVVFTICLKVLLSPLDIWQKRTMMKNNRAMKIITPELEKLKKTYANAPDVLQQKQMELYKKNGYSMTGGCLPALITIVIFFVVFAGFNAAVRGMNEAMVVDMTDSYTAIVSENPEIGEEELDARMTEAFNEQKHGWLWVKNVFMSDTYINPVPTYEKFVGRGLGQIGATLPAKTKTLLIPNSRYDTPYDAVLKPAMNSYARDGFFDMKKWNGYFILPLLSITLSVFSMKISKTNQPEMPTQNDENGNPVKNGQGMMKAMNWMMPIMMGIFAIFYSAAFCIYMVTNSLITVVFNLVYNAIAKKREDKEEDMRLAATFKRNK